MKTIILILLSISCVANAANQKIWKHKVNQHDVWSCHIFTTVALLEAEYYKTTKKHINLSEADLFLKHIKKGAPNWDIAIKRYLYKGIKLNEPHLLETGFLANNLKLIQKYGIAKENEIKYSPIYKMGLPMTMNLLRNSITKTKLSLKQGNKIDTVIANQISLLKKNGVLKNLQQDLKYFRSRAETKSFASQYTMKQINMRKHFDLEKIKTMLKTGPIAIDYDVVKRKNSRSIRLCHTVIVTLYDERQKCFIVRNSDNKSIFGKPTLDVNFLKNKIRQVSYLSRK